MSPQLTALLEASTKSAIALGVAKVLTAQLSDPDLELLRAQAQDNFMALVSHLEMLEANQKD